MTRERWFALAGALLLAAAIALTALAVRSPKLTAEANLRYAGGAENDVDDDMAELLELLGGD